MGLVEHFEQHLGRIESGWSKNADGAAMPFQVVRFLNPAGPGTIGFATLGLSRHELHGSQPDQTIRCELLMLVLDGWRDGPIPGIMQQVGRDILSNHHAPLRGEVIGPYGPLVGSSQLEALYAALPVYLPDSFATYEDDGEQIVIIWLIPISAGEAEFVTDSGWSEFENALSDTDLQLMDLNREVLKLDQRR